MGISIRYLWTGAVPGYIVSEARPRGQDRGSRGQTRQSPLVGARKRSFSGQESVKNPRKIMNIGKATKGVLKPHYTRAYLYDFWRWCLQNHSITDSSCKGGQGGRSGLREMTLELPKTSHVQYLEVLCWNVHNGILR